jgi:hypothetical protein
MPTPLPPAAVTTFVRSTWPTIGIPFKFYLVKADYAAANSDFKIMRFDGCWSEEFDLGRSNVSITVVEVA